MSGRYIYDDDQVKFKKEGRNVTELLLKVLKYALVSVAVAILYYFVFALFFKTDTERRLEAENRMMEKVYPEMEKKDQLLDDVLEGLQVRDDEIYNDVFQSPAPNMNRLSSVELLSAGGSAADADIVERTSQVLGAVAVSTSAVEANFREIFGRMSSDDFVMPPMELPFKEFSYAMTGASVGSKTNPFYKVRVNHTGIDFIANTGTQVYATADGVVSKVTRSRSGMGNVVEISHKGGFVTKYAHLETISVSRGRSVRSGALIGTVGISGQTFAPHLHYEVLKDGQVCDPVNYFFASVPPDIYANMYVMAQSTEQSMD